jgi:hypothetical protein
MIEIESVHADYWTIALPKDPKLLDPALKVSGNCSFVR